MLPFSIGPFEIARALGSVGITDGAAACHAGSIALVLKCIADVKGSPFDPASETIVRLRAS